MQKMCTDFHGRPLQNGDWVIRAVQHGSSSAHLAHSRLEEDPQPKSNHGWEFWIRTYNIYSNDFGKRGKASNHSTMYIIDEAEVPKEIVEAYARIQK